MKAHKQTPTFVGSLTASCRGEGVGSFEIGTPSSDLGRIENAALQASVAAAPLDPETRAALADPLVELRPSRSTSGGPGTYRLRWRGKSLSLKVKGDRPREEAVAVARLVIMRDVAAVRGILAPQDVTIASVVDYALSEWHPGKTASRRDQDTYANYVRSLARMVRHFPGRTLGDVTGKTITRYLDACAEIPDARFKDEADRPTLTRATAHIDLITFRMALNMFKNDRRLAWAPSMKLPPAPKSARTGFFDRPMVARILMACRGRIFDPVTGDWKTEEVTDPETGCTVVRRVLHGPVERNRREFVRRYVLIGMYTGTRQDVAINLCWRMHPHRGCIDVEAGIIHRAGYAESPEEGKPRASSAIRAELMTHLPAWRRNDKGRGISYVLHKPRGADRGKPFRYFPYDVWWDVMRDAGLDRGADPHVLCHTALTWLGADGYHIDLAADLTGRDVDTVRKVYRQHNLGAQKRAVGIGRLPVVKHLKLCVSDASDAPRRADRYRPRGRGGKHMREMPAPGRRRG